MRSKRTAGNFGQSSIGRPGGGRQSAGSCLPRAMFGLLAVAVALLAALEVRNVLLHPSLLRVGAAGTGGRLTFFQEGPAAQRNAWLFHEPDGTGGRPVPIQRIDCTAADAVTGAIALTADGAAVFAESREERPPHRDAELLWLYEFDGRRLFVRDPEWAVRGRTAIQVPAPGLADRWRRHGGTGAAVASWYDLGKRGSHLFFWQATRWRRELPD